MLRMRWVKARTTIYRRLWIGDLYVGIALIPWLLYVSGGGAVCSAQSYIAPRRWKSRNLHNPIKDFWSLSAADVGVAPVQISAIPRTQLASPSLCR
ncbi:hypothetical protein LY76DRAFT_108368 [Colletotrichum caudatum]|nr:hypothetical protein LY76DRAFT_108368 [Colletotrichum caudatum]